MSAEALSNVIELEPKDESPADKLERDVYRFIQANAGQVGGHVPLANLMEIDPGDLTRALTNKGRYLSIGHIMRLGDRLTKQAPEAGQRLAALIMKPFDMVVFPRVQLTAAERARRHENTLRRIGASLGVDLVAQSLETP